MNVENKHESADIKPSSLLNKKLLLIELNEFDPDFLAQQSERLGLKNLSALLSMTYSETTTDDEVEHQGLDPWVQWVNVHTGRPSKKHGVKRLGDTVKQRATETQLWEAVGRGGGKWLAWGVMNAPLGQRAGCELFMPDPWSFEEEAYPARLNDVLALPRYMARNYTDAKKRDMLINFACFVKAYAPPAHWPTLLKFIKTALISFKRHGISVHTLTTLLDYLGALEFSRARRKSNIDFSVIFLNHIAHLQHQFWLRSDKPHHEMELGLKICDLTMGLLLDSRQEDEAIILMNGLRQKNVAGEGVHVYRQINPEKAVQAILGTARDWSDWSVEQLMTNDAHIRFKTREDADAAESLITTTKLETGQDVFFTERLSETDVFCQIGLEQAVDAKSTVSNAATTFNFYDNFELVCERTGAHLQEGDVFSDKISVPRKLYNHEIYKHILDHLESTQELSLG